MEPDVSLHHSQQPTTRPYPKPRQSSSSPHPTSCYNIPISPARLILGLPCRLFPTVYPIKTLYITNPVFPTCRMPYPSPFLSFGNLNNIQWTVQTINHLTKRHLPVVLPVCPLPEIACMYRLCYRGHTAADDVHTICGSCCWPYRRLSISFSVICKWIDWF